MGPARGEGCRRGRGWPATLPPIRVGEADQGLGQQEEGPQEVGQLAPSSIREFAGCSEHHRDWSFRLLRHFRSIAFYIERLDCIISEIWDCSNENTSYNSKKSYFASALVDFSCKNALYL